MDAAEPIIDGCLHTGDVVNIGSCGYVVSKDCIRDVVVTGVLNIYPSDADAALG